MEARRILQVHTSRASVVSGSHTRRGTNGDQRSSSEGVESPTPRAAYKAASRERAGGLEAPTGSQRLQSSDHDRAARKATERPTSPVACRSAIPCLSCHEGRRPQSRRRTVSSRRMPLVSHLASRISLRTPVCRSTTNQVSLPVAVAVAVARGLALQTCFISTCLLARLVSHVMSLTSTSSLFRSISRRRRQNALPKLTAA